MNDEPLTLQDLAHAVLRLTDVIDRQNARIAALELALFNDRPAAEPGRLLWLH